MLDSETRRRIDTARDILVGKVPDPKSQVEQITIALVYKFMDDMDKQSVEMGGKASFFKGEFKKYGWSEIFDPRLGGVEMLNLYGEAITRMSQNANLPELFRNIFKNAFLPYRDPETLKLFLKTINEFTYDNSEKLGDAFEYLLSVLGSQGEAGQFRTPRHIIDFMVKVIDPKKNETVLDPACGTAGFLISAYKYIIQSTQKVGKPLTTQEKQKLYDNFTGYDISPDMVRLSLVNLYLHGFIRPNIHEYDTLTSEERWNEYADVILANPPFMSPKGGIQPHKRFSVQSNRSEVLFVDYMAEHLTPSGRAAIIVPEGIIFQSAGAYRQLRKYLIEHNYLWAVVSLPVGVFNPYAGVKTSILFLDKALAKKTDQILFVKVEKDGYDLGAQRRALCNDMGDKPELCARHSDLPDSLNTLREWQKTVPGGNPSSFHPTIASALLVSTSRLAENGDYNLSADRYREVTRAKHGSYPMTRLRDITEIQKGSPITKKKVEDGNIPVIAGGQQPAYFHNVSNRDGNVITVSASGAYAGFLNYFDVPIFASDCTTIKSSDERKLLTYFLFLLLKNKQEKFYALQKGMGQPHVYAKDFIDFQIPQPPIEIQRQIVDEIAARQRIIDGARQVVDGWKPNLEFEDGWKDVKIGDICEVKGGKRLPKGEAYAKEKTKHPYIRVVDLIGGTVDTSDLRYITDDIFKVIKNYTISSEDVYISIAGTIGLLGTVPHELNGANLTENAAKLVLQKGKIDKNFLKYVGMSDFVQQQVKKLTHAVGVPKLALERIKTIQIPLPTLDKQREIVTHIEREQSIVEGNRELIRIYKEKVKKVVDKVWEE